jgi:hypothetical protein
MTKQDKKIKENTRVASEHAVPVDNFEVLRK